LVWRSFRCAGIVFCIWLEGDDFFEEGDAHEGGFAALPGEDDFIAGLAFDVLADVFFEEVVAHAGVVVVAEEGGFVEVEAVGAVEVAEGASGFDHGVEAGWPAGSLESLGRERGSRGWGERIRSCEPCFVWTRWMQGTS